MTVTFLTEIRRDEKKSGYSWYLCDCGTEKLIRRSAVKNGGTKSCGCHRRRIAVENGKCATTHGMTDSFIYVYWRDLKRHQKVCEHWEKFENFYEDVGKDYREGQGLISNSEEYSKETCRWIDSSTAKQEKTRKTSLGRYGVEHQTQAESVKQKIRKTNLEKYGVECVTQAESVKEKTRQTNLKKYGVPYYSMTDECKTKASERNSNSFNGKTSKEWAEELDISRSYFNQLVRTCGIEYALSHEKTSTRIEQIVSHILDCLGVEFETQKRIGDRFADFYVPEFDVVIEADGHYWHSDAVNDDKMYHFNKKRLYTQAGYDSFFFREGEIVKHGDIVKSILKNRFGQSDRIFARKCELTDLTVEQKKNFFNSNHLMGIGRGKCIALKIDRRIVAAMQYLNKGGVLDVSRFCCMLNTNVVGGFSRLLKQIEQLENPDKIINFVDLRYGTGKHLEQFGFKLETCSVSFGWVKDLEITHRMKYRGKSGYECGYKRIYDCGQAKFVKTADPNAVQYYSS